MTHPPGSQKDQKKAIRRDESDDDEMRQGKRPKVVAKKKTAGSNAGKNPPEERTLDSSPNYPAFQSSSEGKHFNTFALCLDHFVGRLYCKMKNSTKGRLNSVRPFHRCSKTSSKSTTERQR